MLTQPFGYWGFVLFATSLGIACFGAALQVTLDTAYIVAQALGRNWGENFKPKDAARFSWVYTGAGTGAGAPTSYCPTDG